MGAGSSRYRQIGAVLRRHGLGVLAGVLGLGGLVPFHRGALGHARQEDPYTNPEHVRVALEELGPTFVKLGQILSTRHDLLPQSWIAEFTKLQDAAAPAPWEQIVQVLETPYCYLVASAPMVSQGQSLVIVKDSELMPPEQYQQGLRAFLGHCPVAPSTIVEATGHTDQGTDITDSEPASRNIGTNDSTVDTATTNAISR